ncbi:hypothetical protein HKCCE3408_12140 [Rhodobacterales bacterium HKCCE3408]|nr:hypothetical protein [Rhodobacterales bacterium HKCCE3408]
MRLIALGFCLLLAGCGTLGALGSASRPLDVYELRAPTDIGQASGSPLQRVVTVELPETSGTLDTDRIMIRPDNLQAQYLPDARWGEEVPVMVQTLMLRSLSSTGGILYVGRRPLASSGDYAIVTELVDFQAEARETGAVVQISMTVRILRESDAVIFATRTFSSEAVAADTDTETLVAAFDTAMSDLLRSFTPWAMARMGRPL